MLAGLKLSALIASLWVAFRLTGTWALVLVPLIAVFANIWIREIFTFEPFWIHIQPTKALFLDFGVATVAELDEVERSAKQKEYWPLRDGVRFTILRLGLLAAEGNLIFWNQESRFTTTIDSFVQYPELSRPSALGRGLGHKTTAPSLTVRTTVKGIQIAVRPVDRSWQTVAEIPYCTFRTARWRSGLVSERARSQRLSSGGWTEPAREDGGPAELRHPHVTVNWGYI